MASSFLKQTRRLLWHFRYWSVSLSLWSVVGACVRVAARREAVRGAGRVEQCVVKVLVWEPRCEILLPDSLRLITGVDCLAVDSLVWLVRRSKFSVLPRNEVCSLWVEMCVCGRVSVGVSGDVGGCGWGDPFHRHMGDLSWWVTCPHAPRKFQKFQSLPVRVCVCVVWILIQVL